MCKVLNYYSSRAAVVVSESPFCGCELRHWKTHAQGLINL